MKKLTKFSCAPFGLVQPIPLINWEEEKFLFEYIHFLGPPRDSSMSLLSKAQARIKFPGSTRFLQLCRLDCESIVEKSVKDVDSLLLGLREGVEEVPEPKINYLII